MKLKKTNIALLSLIVISFAIAFYYYPQMPEEMASHWNTKGEVDGTMNKGWALFLMPAITVLMYLMYIFIPKIDPLKKNIEKFRTYFDGFILLIAIFFLYITILTIAANLGYEFNMTTMILPAIGILFIYISFLMKHAQRNWFIGIRTPWTLSDDRVWKKTHALGSKLFMAAGILIFLSVFVQVWTIWIVVVSAIIAGVWPVVYSYFEYVKLKGGKE